MQLKLMHYLILVVMLLTIFLSLISLSSEIIQAENYTSPIFINSTLYPLKVYPGEIIEIASTLYDFLGVKYVQAKLFYEKGFDIVNLSLTSGSRQNGIWEGSWKVHDTITKDYIAIITAFSISGYNSSVSHLWSDPTTWWNSNWLHRMPINITNSGSSLFNYQVKIELDSSNVGDNFDWDVDNDSLRFTYYNSTTDAEVECPFYIEEWDTPSQNAIVWVNVSYLPSSSNSLVYMYYDNSLASSGGSGDDTFDFYDHFEGSSLDTNKWQIDANSYSVANSELRINIGGVSKKDPFPFSLNDGYILEGKIKYVSASGGYSGTLSGQSSHYTQGSNGGADATNLYMRNSGSTLVYRWTGDGSTSGYNCGSSNVWSSSNDVWYTLGAKFYSGGVYLVRDRTTNYGPYGCGWSKNINYISLGAFYGASNYNIQDTIYDWVLIRKYVPTEPTYILGTEEEAIPSQPNLSLPVNNSSTNDITPIFQWNNGGNTDVITLLVDDELDLSDGDEWINISLDSSIENYTTPGPEALTEGQWYWMVVANNSQGKNSSIIWNFVVDVTSPLPPTLNQPSNDSTTNNNQVTFRWNASVDSPANTTQVSNIACYQLQVDNNQDFSSPLINDNTSDNLTLMLTRSVEGRVYWRVRAWDQAGNPGTFSETRSLIVFNFDLDASSSTLQIQRGNSDVITISIEEDFGDIENVSLESYWSSDVKPSSITLDFSSQREPLPFESTATFNCGSSASTGTFTCTINATSDSGIKKIINVTVTVYSMLFSIDGFPRTLSLIRSDSETVTISVEFDQGVLEDVFLSGEWIDDTPEGVMVGFDIYSGTPPFDSIFTISTTSSAEAGSFVYKITGEGSGLTKSFNLYVNILTDLTLTAETDKISYYKGQKIQISGIVKNENDDLINIGTATISLTTQNWNYKYNTSISKGVFNSYYYISFDKPDGNWTISITAKDNRGHVTLSSTEISISILIPESYKHYIINVINPIAGQVFERGETIFFTISATENNNKIVGLNVRASTLFGEEILFSESSPGIYSANYDLSYDCSLGDWSVYIEGTKFEEEKLKAGFNYINYKVQPTRPILEIIEPKSNSVEVGETIKLKVRVIYPNGNPVEEGIITAIKPEGGTLLFTKSGLNLYSADYTPVAESIGNWWIEIKVEDAYGNYGILIGDNIEVIQASITSNLVRYWWATIISFLIIIVVGIYLTSGKIQKTKLQNLKQETIEFENLKRENAIQYFTRGKISRQTYDQLFQDYESKIANLTKKTRLLERKVKNKKPLLKLIKIGYKNEK